jgi:hypothetical protein
MGEVRGMLMRRMVRVRVGMRVLLRVGLGLVLGVMRLIMKVRMIEVVMVCRPIHQMPVRRDQVEEIQLMRETETSGRLVLAFVPSMQLLVAILIMIGSRPA